jgi:hypothetical protein
MLNGRFLGWTGIIRAKMRLLLGVPQQAVAVFKMLM